MTSKTTILALLTGIAMVGVSLPPPAHALSSAAVADTSAPISKSETMQLADPSAGSVGFKKSKKKAKKKT